MDATIGGVVGLVGLLVANGSGVVVGGIAWLEGIASHFGELVTGSKASPDPPSASSADTIHAAIVNGAIGGPDRSRCGGWSNKALAVHEG